MSIKKNVHGIFPGSPGPMGLSFPRLLPILGKGFLMGVWAFRGIWGFWSHLRRSSQGRNVGENWQNEKLALGELSPEANSSSAG